VTRAPKRQLRRQQRRKRKLRFLRRRLAEATDIQERRRLIAKIRKVSPRASVPER
jgi:indole-3-glycerol phosphate synthase